MLILTSHNRVFSYKWCILLKASSSRLAATKFRELPSVPFYWARILSSLHCLLQTEEVAFNSTHHLEEKTSIYNMYFEIQPRTGLSADFRVCGALAREGGEID